MVVVGGEQQMADVSEGDDADTDDLRMLRASKFKIQVERDLILLRTSHPLRAAKKLGKTRVFL
jgi:hypothetical protein